MSTIGNGMRSSAESSITTAIRRACSAAAIRGASRSRDASTLAQNDSVPDIRVGERGHISAATHDVGHLLHATGDLRVRNELGAVRDERDHRRRDDEFGRSAVVADVSPDAFELRAVPIAETSGAAVAGLPIQIADGRDKHQHARRRPDRNDHGHSRTTVARHRRYSPCHEMAGSERQPWQELDSGVSPVGRIQDHQHDESASELKEWHFPAARITGPRDQSDAGRAEREANIHGQAHLVELHRQRGEGGVDGAEDEYLHQEIGAEQHGEYGGKDGERSEGDDEHGRRGPRAMPPPEIEHNGRDRGDRRELYRERDEEQEPGPDRSPHRFVVVSTFAGDKRCCEDRHDEKYFTFEDVIPEQETARRENYGGDDAGDDAVEASADGEDDERASQRGRLGEHFGRSDRRAGDVKHRREERLEHRKMR